jgi:hypothetical protein
VLLARATLPSTVVPSRKLTLPLAVVPVDGCTVAVNVTACPTLTGFAEVATVVAVEAGFTVSPNPVDVLPLKFASPL